MEIRFSRHAKRRAKLYKIPEEVIIKLLKEKHFNEGEYEIIENIPGFKYPIKIVISVENDKIVIITNYPVKRKRKK